MITNFGYDTINVENNGLLAFKIVILNMHVGQKDLRNGRFLIGRYIYSNVTK